MDLREFNDLMTILAAYIGDRPLDERLERDLNETFPPGGPDYERIFSACRSGINAKLMCTREADGIKFGRVLKPDSATRGFSVDVVDMQDVVGPHHVHPNGEIDLVMPLATTAKFDGQGAGWRVYGRGSAHSPTVRGGRALVLYLLPEGKIEFTKTAR